MPLYEYHCDANGMTIEVRHGMSETIDTWGEACERAGIDVGDTPADAPVARRLSAPVPLTGRSADTAPSSSGPAPCGPSCACAFDA